MHVLVEYRGLNNYLYYFGDSLLQLYYEGSRNPIPIIKAPIITLSLWFGQGPTGDRHSFATPYA